MGNKISVKIAENRKEMSDAKDVRRQVFQIEQGIDSKLDFDGEDDKADHVIAYLRGKAIGTARIRYLPEKTAKIERVSVLKEYRGKGAGKGIMEYIVCYLRGKSAENIKLDSQEYAKVFYEKLGFKQRGKVFQEAGVPHVEMWLKGKEASLRKVT